MVKRGTPLNVFVLWLVSRSRFRIFVVCTERVWPTARAFSCTWTGKKFSFNDHSRLNILPSLFNYFSYGIQKSSDGRFLWKVLLTDILVCSHYQELGLLGKVRGKIGSWFSLAFEREKPTRMSRLVLPAAACSLWVVISVPLSSLATQTLYRITTQAIGKGFDLSYFTWSCDANPLPNHNASDR